MKKFLLATAAVISTVSFVSAASADGAPRVTVGGFYEFQAGHIDQDLDTDQRSHGFRNNTEIHFRVDGTTDNGLNYGAVVEMEADITDDISGSGTNADRTFGFVQGNFGTVEMGGNTDAATALKVDASTNARATGGIDGAWHDFANKPSSNFIMRPDLPVSHGVSGPGDSENATKITYYSPDMNGLQFGASYTPSEESRGNDFSFSDDDAGRFENVFSGGAAYNGDLGGAMLGVSATAEYGDNETTGEDLEAYALGASVSANGFNFAGSWGDWQESRNATGLDGGYWTLGAGYETGPFAVSVSYIDSEREVAGGDNEFTNLVFGTDYAAAPGMTPYAEVSLFEFDAPGAGSDNDGTVFIVGTQFAF